MLGYCAECHEPQYKSPAGPVCENGHGGAGTLEELPRCARCEAVLKPAAKFCAECGEPTGPESELVEDVQPCPGCGSPVSPGAKFCAECGHKLGEPSGHSNTREDKTVKMPQKSEPEPGSESKAENKDKVKTPVRKSEPGSKKTVKTPVKEEPEEVDGAKPEEEFDFSSIDPENDWECFGQIEPDNFECKECAFRERCAEKAGVEI